MRDNEERQTRRGESSEGMMVAEPESMDALSAHLDRGWEMLFRGDVWAARQSAKKALDVDSGSSDAHTLQGAVAFSEGQPEDALLEFEQAMDLDPDNPEPVVFSAEVLAKDPENAQEAVARIDDALDLLWESDAVDLRAQAILVKAEALVALGQETRAKIWLKANLAHIEESPSLYERAGVLLAKLSLDEEAKHFLTASLEGPHGGAAHYFLGRYALDEGRPDEAVDRFVETRHHDLQEPGPAWAYSLDAFWILARKAALDVAARYGLLLREEDIFLETYPGLEAILAGGDPRAPVAGDWWPKGRRYGSVYVIVYQFNVERLCLYPDEVPDRLEEELDALMSRLAGARPT